MRIAILTQTYPPMVSGAALTARNLAEGLAARGHSVMVLTSSADDRASKEGHASLSVIRFRSHVNPLRAEQRFAGWPHRQIVTRLRSFAPHAVLLFDPLAFGLSGWRYCRSLRVPLIFTAEQLPWFLAASLPRLRPLAPLLEGVLWGYMGWLMRQSDAVVAPTGTIAAVIGSRVHRPVHAISNGVNLDAFTPSPLGPAEESGLRARLDLPPQAQVILYVGRLDADKRVDQVLLASLRAMDANGAHLVLVGDGTQKESLQRLAARHGVSGRCRFTGFVRDPAELSRLYRLARLFVNASEIETQGITLLEAAASGTPIVAVRATCIPEIVHHDVNGFLALPGDLDSLAAGIRTLLADPALARRMGRAGAGLARAHDLPHTIRAYEELALSLAAGRLHRRAFPATLAPGRAEHSGAPD